MKSYLCVHESGSLVVVKVFSKEDGDAPLRLYEHRIRDVRAKLAMAMASEPRAALVASMAQSERAVFLVRQYLHSSLAQRVSRRPFLLPVEKVWIAHQLLAALARFERAGVVHGDLKPANVLLTSWGWVALADVASYKPPTLPADNPAPFSLFYDTMPRRTCCIAPERFVSGHSAGRADDGLGGGAVGAAERADGGAGVGTAGERSGGSGGDRASLAPAPPAPPPAAPPGPAAAPPLAPELGGARADGRPGAEASVLLETGKRGDLGGREWGSADGASDGTPDAARGAVPGTASGATPRDGANAGPPGGGAHLPLSPRKGGGGEAAVPSSADRASGRAEAAAPPSAPPPPASASSPAPQEAAAAPLPTGATHAADIFSAGATIAQLFLDGDPLFDYSEVRQAGRRSRVRVTGRGVGLGLRGRPIRKGGNGWGGVV